MRGREREKDRERVYYSIETYICSIPIMELKKKNPYLFKFMDSA